jgi:hypothetical protein
MMADLQVAVRKWHGKHETKGGLLSVDIKHFAGPLPGYDETQPARLFPNCLLGIVCRKHHLSTQTPNVVLVVRSLSD